MVEYVGRDIGPHLDALMPLLDANKWFTYGRLLLEEVRGHGLMQDHPLDTLAAKLDASRLAGEDHADGP